MRRRSTAGLLIAVVAGLAVGCSEPAEERVDLDEVIDSQVASLSPEGPYRDPKKAERETAREAVGLLLAASPDRDRAGQLLEEIGYRVTHGVDAVDGRQYVMFTAADDTGWAGMIVDPSARIGSVVEVPHPSFDRNTDKLGMSLYRTLPGSMLLIAGAHRQAAGGAGDVAHNDRSMFQVISEQVAERGVPQLQLHGFAERSLPGADAVVSTGSGPHNEYAVRVARELKAEQLQVCRAWVSRCVGLEGTTNVQSSAASEHDAEFVHLELSWSLRRDQAGRDQVRDAVTVAWKG